jgi:tetratricopeptide (TPR) repeat protein
MPDATAASWQVPESLAGVMEKQIARLPAELCSILEVASVCGVEFRPQTIAEALERDVQWAGARCDELVRQQQWIGHVAVSGLPDGSLGARYAFRHALYKHVFYQRIGALTRAQLHRNVALSLERSRAGGLAVTAAELASHYDRGHDAMAALKHYIDAADNALSQFAQVEAVSLTGQALALLPRCPENPERWGLELALLLKRGVACAQLLGMGSDEAKDAFDRAQAVCDRLPETPALGWTLHGVGMTRYGHGDYSAAQAFGERIHVLAERYDDPGLLIAACNLIGMSCAAHGEYAKAQQWLQRGVATCDGLAEPLPPDRFFIDPGVSMQSHLGLYLLAGGLFDQARMEVEAALERANKLGLPMSKTLATRSVCMLEMWLRQPERVASMAAMIDKYAGDYGIVYAKAMGPVLGGWSQAHQGDPDAGHARIVQGHEMIKGLGVVAVSTQLLCYAAEASVLAGRWPEAQAHVDEGLQLAQRLGERVRVCDLLLLQARVALGQGRMDDARRAMRKSLDEARAQQALGFELAALVALCELDDVTADELDALKTACDRVTEGRDTPLVNRARELIARGGATVST